MSYVALYRKFRPDNFIDVKGQDHIVTTLKNQIKANRVGHAYLFCGTRGTGKTTIAKLFAKTVNCQNPQDGSPCGECDCCKRISAGVSLDVVEMDAASNNSVDDIREIIDAVSYSPTEGKYKVYIIDEVHMLSNNAFNALLKTLEEPPSYCLFILATTEVHKIPITILSRCQRYDFKRITIDTIADRLEELMEKEDIDVEPKAIRYIAKTADGSMRDALSLLDQCIAFHYGETLTYDAVLDVLGAVDTVVFSKMLRYILEQNVNGSIRLLEEIIMQGRELTQFITDFTWYLRNLLVLKTTDDSEDLLDLSSDNKARLTEEASMCEAETILRYIRIFSELSNSIRYATQKRIMVEIAIIKLCRPEMESTPDSVVDRVRVVEDKIEKGLVKVSATSAVEASVPQYEKAKLPSALPEDIQKIISNWNAIAKNIEGGYKNAVLAATKSLSKDNNLLLVCPNESVMCDMLFSEGAKEYIEKVIGEVVHKQVTVEIQKAPTSGPIDSVYPDIMQIAGINTAIIEEE